MTIRLGHRSEISKVRAQTYNWLIPYDPSKCGRGGDGGGGEEPLWR